MKSSTFGNDNFSHATHIKNYVHRLTSGTYFENFELGCLIAGFHYPYFGHCVFSDFVTLRVFTVLVL